MEKYKESSGDVLYCYTSFATANRRYEALVYLTEEVPYTLRDYSTTSGKDNEKRATAGVSSCANSDRYTGLASIITKDLISARRCALRIVLTLTLPYYTMKLHLFNAMWTE